MWLVPFLLVLSLPVQGELKLTLVQSSRPAGDSVTILDVSYEIPNTSLAFLREDGGFVARYEISVQFMDRRRGVVAGDLWQRIVHYREYGPTVSRDSVETGTVSLVVPRAALDARVDVKDQASDRFARSEFRIERPTGGLVVQLYRSGRPAMMGKYGIGDTLVAEARAASPRDRIDSCRFALKRDQRVVIGATVQTTTGDDGVGAQLVARFEYPIGDSAGVARLGGGEYSLDVTGFGTGLALFATTAFRVDVPFFLEDSAYLDRVDKLIYVASTEEMRRLRSLPRSERQQAWGDFWKRKEQLPIKGRYLTEDEYFERIGYAEEHFGHGDRGYLSDRGRVYVLYGPADQIESRPFDIDSPASEVWYYYQINKEFDFVDKFGAGQLVLQNPEEL